MKCKKILSAVLACSLLASMSVSAFAAATDLTQSSEITGTTQVPTINITVAATGTVTVNPYQMEVTVGSKQVTDQIISATQYVESLSDVALNVSATVTGKAEGTLKFATSPTNGTKPVTTNSVFMYFEAGEATANDGTGDPTWAAAYDAKSANQILIGAKATTKALGTMDASDGSTAVIWGYHLTGDAAPTPTVAWTANDKASATIAFTFTPTVSPSAGA